MTSRGSPRAGDSRRHSNPNSLGSNSARNARGWEPARGEIRENHSQSSRDRSASKQDIGSPQGDRERNRQHGNGSRQPPPLRRLADDTEDGEVEEYDYGHAGSASQERMDPPNRSGTQDTRARPGREEDRRRGDPGSATASKPLDRLSAMRAKLLAKKRQVQSKKKDSGSSPVPAQSPSAQRNKPNSAYYAQDGPPSRQREDQNRVDNQSPRRSPSAGAKRKSNTLSAPGPDGRKTAKTNAYASASSVRKNTSKTSVPVLKKPLSGPNRSTTKGVCWRKTEKDMRNSTVCFKSILRSAMYGKTSKGKVGMDAQFKNLDKAKNWESDYVPFVFNVLVALAKDQQNAVRIAQEGVRAAHECFTFIRDGEEQPLLQAMHKYVR